MAKIPRAVLGLKTIASAPLKLSSPYVLFLAIQENRTAVNLLFLCLFSGKFGF